MAEKEVSGTKSLQYWMYEILGAFLSVKEAVGGIVRSKSRKINGKE